MILCLSLRVHDVNFFLKANWKQALNFFDPHDSFCLNTKWQKKMMVHEWMYVDPVIEAAIQRCHQSCRSDPSNSKL
jgi:hypothetical protein